MAVLKEKILSTTDRSSVYKTGEPIMKNILTILMVFCLVMISVKSDVLAYGNCRSACCHDASKQIRNIYGLSSAISKGCWSTIQMYRDSDRGKIALACDADEINFAKKMERSQNVIVGLCNSECVEIRQKNICVRGKNINYYMDKLGM